MKQIGTHIAALLWGLGIGLGLASGPYHSANDELTALKHEAIRRGFAHYTNDIDGKSTFVWREK